MKNIKLIRCLLLLALGLQIRCATTGTNIKKNSKEAEVYLKRVSSEVVENQSKKKKCIVESHIEKQSWENIVAKGNACVSAGNFYQVERYGDYLATEHHLGPWDLIFSVLQLSIEVKKIGLYGW